MPRLVTRGGALCLAVFLVILLAACTPAQQVALEGGIEAAQRAKDAEGRVLKSALCAMSIGAYHRLNSDLERRALDVLCGGIEGALSSAADLEAVR